MAKAQADIRSLARGHTALAVRTLARIAAQRSAPPSAQVAAAAELLDRGWGRAATVVAGADGGPIQVIIRQIIDITGERQSEPVLISSADVIEHDEE